MAVVIWSGKGGARKTIDGRPVARVQRVEQIHDAMNRGTEVKLFNAKLLSLHESAASLKLQSLKVLAARSHGALSRKLALALASFRLV